MDSLCGGSINLHTTACLVRKALPKTIYARTVPTRILKPFVNFFPSHTRTCLPVTMLYDCQEP